MDALEEKHWSQHWVLQKVRDLPKLDGVYTITQSKTGLLVDAQPNFVSKSVEV